MSCAAGGQPARGSKVPETVRHGRLRRFRPNGGLMEDLFELPSSNVSMLGTIGTKFGIPFCRCLLRHVRAALAGPSSMYWSTVFLPSKRRALSPRMAGALVPLLFLAGCSGGVLEPKGPIGAANTKIIYNALAVKLVGLPATIVATA